MSSRFVLSAVLLPLAGLAAQGAGAPAGVALVVKTANEDMVERLADQFAYEGDVPSLDDGECFVVSVSADRKVSITAEKAGTTYFHLRARPGVLADMFADELAQMQRVAIAGASARFGASPSEVGAFVEEVFAFPRQLADVRIDVTGTPEAGLEGKVHVTPVSGGWFAAFVDAAKRSPAGAPVLQDGDALFTVAADLDAATVARTARPFLPFVVGAAAGGKEERRKYTALMADLAGCLDGTFAFALRGAGREHRYLAGLADPEKARELLAGKDFAAWRLANAEANPMVETEVTENALSHREVAATKTVHHAIGPTGEEVKTEQFTGAAGAFLFGAGSEADAKGLIDAILDQKVTRKPLPGNALVTLSAKMAEIAGVMSGGRADTGDVPARIDVALAKQGNVLQVTFKVEP